MSANEPKVRPTLVRERREFASELQLIKHKACKLGLYATMQQLDHATKAVGWEIARLETKEAPNGE